MERSQESENSFETRLDILRLVKSVFRYMWLIVLCAATGFFSCRYLAEKLTKNLYSATATMYISTNNPNYVNAQSASTSDLNTATRLIETYLVVIRSDRVMNAVAERLDFAYPTSYISSVISAGSVNETEIMAITATTPDPQLSMDICNAVAELAPTEIIRVVNAGYVEMIDYATLPSASNARPIMRYALMGALAGLMLAGMIITALIKTDKRIYESADLSNRYTIPVLAEIPDMKKCTRRLSKRKRKRMKGENPLLLSEKTHPFAVEAYKRLRIRLQFAMENTDSKVIVITSAVPEEGKSTLAANLSVILAQEKRVLLIDADMRRSVQAQYFDNAKSEVSLTKVLQSPNLFEVALKRIRENLDILPSGTQEKLSTEWLHSKQMRLLIEKLRKEYDWVIMDTPPVNIVSDALVLSDLADGVLWVTRAAHSTYTQIDKALNMALPEMKVRGFVMTGMDVRKSKRKDKYYNYYAHYSAGYNRFDGSVNYALQKTAAK